MSEFDGKFREDDYGCTHGWIDDSEPCVYCRIKELEAELAYQTTASAMVIMDLQDEHPINCMCANCSKHKDTLTKTVMEYGEVVGKLEVEVAEMKARYEGSAG